MDKPVVASFGYPVRYCLFWNIIFDNNKLDLSWIVLVIPTALGRQEDGEVTPGPKHPSVYSHLLVSGRGSQMVKVSDRGWLVSSLSPVPLKTRRVGERYTLNLSRAQTSSHWCGVVVKRGRCQLRCRPRHLTTVQNYEVNRQKSSCS
ncbi:uncharacterized protein TNCV_2542191 [Trichonephila clavipes]|nr:uncharacterized protein TNCV_2542191 [Trichonephila clavipes]